MDRNNETIRLAKKLLMHGGPLTHIIKRLKSLIC